MKVAELIEALQQLNPELPVCIDVDDGVKGNFVDALRVTVHQHWEGAFVVIDSKFVETVRHHPGGTHG